ncbi:hypothetical protein HYT55_04985 [Candidatus Woesearchaeota archaeon]|nr:hypothetical protein [Candidatus Woesearchaeota archaeon]
MKQNWHNLGHFVDAEKNKIKNIESRILTSLMCNPQQTFNELWKKEGASNKFAYHLKVLGKKGLVEKNEIGKYQLTVEGKKSVAHIEQDKGNVCEFPIIAIITLVVKGSQYLLMHRTKEPFYGYWGLHGGKLRSTNYILEQAKESIQRETGLTCDVELKGLFSSKTYVNDKFSYSHQLFIVRATDPKGVLLLKTRKGVNRWVEKKDVTGLKTLPNIPHLIKIATGKRFRWIEADRFQEGNDFTKMDVKKDILL